MDIYNTNNGNNGYVGIGTGTVRTPLVTKLQLFMPYLPSPTYNRLSAMLEAEITQNCPSIAELAIAKMPHVSIYSSFDTAGDAVLTTRGKCSEDLIFTITDSSRNGKMRFGTTPQGSSYDIERMTIWPNGKTIINPKTQLIQPVGKLDINVGTYPPSLMSKISFNYDEEPNPAICLYRWNGNEQNPDDANFWRIEIDNPNYHMTLPIN